MPTYDFLVYLFGAFITAILLDRRHSQVILMPALAMWILYGSGAMVGGLMITFLCGFFSGLMTAIRED